jgi:tetratricopeptide (TPR) repeat protein
MGDSSPACEALTLLGRVYRDKDTGILSVESGGATLRMVLREGQVVGVCPVPALRDDRESDLPEPGDSARLKLDQILAEVGLRRGPAWPARVDGPARAEEPPDMGDPRDRIVKTLADAAASADFEATTELPEDAVPTAGAIEPLILEALRGLDPDAVRQILGNPDQRLVTTTALADEQRTLTLTEGYLLSRIDGQLSAREVLQVVPMEPDEAERTLVGLVLTGRVALQPGPAPRARPSPPRSAEAAPTGTSPDGVEAEEAESSSEEPAAADEPLPLEIPFDEPEAPAEEPAPPDMTAEQQTERREIIELFQSLPKRNHYEVLGLERECTAAEIKRAHVTLVKRYHPDTRRDAHLADLHDVLEAIFIRVGEAWEVLGNERSRAAYEARLGPIVRPAAATAPTSPEPGHEDAPSGPDEAPATYVSPEQTLHQARELLGRARYWDAIQVLETAVPHIQPQRHQHRGRILLAQAYAHNPKWVHRAVETLQAVVSEDPANVDAHFELGRLYKEGGLTARSQAAFRRVLELRPGHKKATAELEAQERASGGGLLRRLFGGGDKSA